MAYGQRKRNKLKSERGRAKANTRWRLDRERREFIARHDPVVTGSVLRRIIDIDEITGTAIEIVIRDYDTARQIRKKLSQCGLSLRGAQRESRLGGQEKGYDFGL